MSSLDGPGASGVVASSPSSLHRAVKIQEEALRLNLVGDAVAVAASSVYFCARLVETTANSYVSGPLFRGGARADKENVRQAAIVKLTSILEFKASNELASMAMSLVFPLIFLRFAVALKDVYQSCVARNPDDELDQGTGRRLLDVLDITVLLSAGFYSFLRIPPLEANLRQGLTPQKGVSPWNKATAQDAFDDMMFAHLLALLQAGLLVVFALVKLSARTERSSQRAVERALATEQAQLGLEQALTRLDALVSVSRTKKTSSVQLEGLNEVDDSIVERPKKVTIQEDTPSVIIPQAAAPAPPRPAPVVVPVAVAKPTIPAPVRPQQERGLLDAGELAEWTAAAAVGVAVFVGVFVNYEHIRQALAL